MTHKASDVLDLEELCASLQEGGSFSRSLKNFEPRKEQAAMLADVCDAYLHKKIALIEAGTGTGKSLAYLIPSIALALKTGKKIAISTNTIPLQEQLVHKDIPDACKALNVDLRACLVKGMSNYLCLRKLQEALAEGFLFQEEHTKWFEKIQLFAKTTNSGDRSDIDFSFPYPVWERVCAESDTCSKEKCPYYKECFFFNARKKAEQAHLLVLNHSLFFSDLALRHFHDTSLLPDFSYVVLDEAHHIEDVATEHLSKKIGITQVVKALARISSERSAKVSGVLPTLAKKLSSFAKNDESLAILLQKIKEDFQLQKLRVLTLAFEFFEKLLHLLEEQGAREQKELKLRLICEFLDSTHWESVYSLGGAFHKETMGFAENLLLLCQDISLKEIKELEGPLSELKALSERLKTLAENTKALIQGPIDQGKVRWIEQEGGAVLGGILLVEANVEVKDLLPDALFKKFDSTILVSATLSSGKGFSFVKERLGLFSPSCLEKVKEAIYASPFDYQKQLALILPKGLPSPDEQTYAPFVQKALLEALLGSNGGAFFLFTSYALLSSCFERMKDALQGLGFTLFRQGEASRSHLLEEFRKKDKAVLFGTDSFWEGVDVAGDALRLVAIVKLPFKVPSDPLQQARSQLLRSCGKEPFSSYSLPQAIIKFKQGFGRLIRHREDKGIVLCLDPRLLEKGYGKQFLKSLPHCEVVKPSLDELQTSVRTILQKQKGLAV